MVNYEMENTNVGINGAGHKPFLTKATAIDIQEEEGEQHLMKRFKHCH
jgi:hypothetical protein